MPTRVALVLSAWFGLAAALAGQPPARLGEPTPAESLFQPVGLSRELGVPEPLPKPSPPADPGPVPDPAAPAYSVEILPKWDLAYLPKSGGRGFGIFDVEALSEMRFPFDPDLPPLKVRPGFAVRFWDGPADGPDLPGAVYDFYADVGWRPRPAEWLFLDLRATLGWYTDLDNTSGDAFLPRGHALAIVALSEQFQFVLGAVYTNRVRTTVVPAGGIRYAPSEDTEFRLVFPAPRVSHRFGSWDTYKLRAYVAGEFGGGSWAVERADGRDDTVDYSDLRAIAGVEAEAPNGRSWHVEVGYVFDRRIDFASGVPPTFRPGSTVLFRIGTSF